MSQSQSQSPMELVRLLLFACLLGVPWASPAAGTQEAAQATPPESIAGGTQNALELHVLVTDEVGVALPDTLVQIVSAEVAGAEPRVARTGSDGRAAFTGLGPGEWQVDVRREGFMIYTAYVKLAPGKDPEVGFSSRQRTGGFWAALNVSFARGGDTVGTFASGKQSRKSAEKAEEQARKETERDEREEERADKRAESGDLARVVNRGDREAQREAEKQAREAAQAAEEREREAAELARREAERERKEAERAEKRSDRGELARVERPPEPVDEQPAGESPSQAPSDHAPAEVRSEPAPEPQPVHEPEPQAVRAPEAEVAAPGGPGDRPRLRPNPNLLRAGACRECREGEWSVSAYSRAAKLGASGTACPSDVTRRLAEVAQELALSLAPEYTSFAGALWAEDGNDVLGHLPEAARSAIQAAVGELVAPESSCPLVAAILPRGARFIGFRYLAADRSGELDCLGKEPCEIGEARWLSNPGVERTDSVTLVWGLFENRSRQQDRRAELRVYFVPPKGWLPPN